MFKYGHLRPGTYDLTSKPYREMNDLFKVNKQVKNIILIFLYLQLKRIK